MNTDAGLLAVESVEATGRTEPAVAPVASVSANRPAAAVQEGWATASLRDRLQVLRRARHLLADGAEQMAEVMSPDLQRTAADTLVAEVLPLLAAMRFLEREAGRVLRTRRVGASGRPVWLGRVSSEVERVPLGRVLVIGVSNYPLLLPGVQVVQALVAGNTVIWKPGRGGSDVARRMAGLLERAGLPAGVLAVTNESVRAAEEAIENGVNKIFFTGSAAAGREVMRRAAEYVIPCVMELSGADAAIVLPGAAMPRAARAIGFGLRLNGSATCMAPRRVLLVDGTAAGRLEFVTALERELGAIEAVVLPPAQASLALDLLEEARSMGATVTGGGIDATGRFTPALVQRGSPEMRIAQTDFFAPVLTVMEVAGEGGVVAAQDACPLALTASIFGEERQAKRLAAKLKVGHVSINDVIVPTADPRVPFTGRKQSGFGTTRGEEGLLEMTVPRVIAVRRGRSERRYEPTGEAHVRLFAGMASLLYAGRASERLRGMKRVMAAGRAVAKTQGTKRSGDA